MTEQQQDPPPPKPPGFTVDTHLFRELGELLVGRDSTALIELVKNSYDADANEVVVFGANLTDRARGIIKISDDGVGMDLDAFIRGFLRIASRLRDTGTRKSKRWSRRFTGAKGVGRLAAHKLAAKIDIQSLPFKDDQKQPVAGVTGHIDWDKVERAETIDEIPPDAVRVEERQPAKGDQHGTVLTLSKLRQKWTKTQLGNFLVEVEGLRAPPALCAKLPKTVSETLLFDDPKVVDASSSDRGFKVRLEGDFEVGENYWPAVIQSSNWLLEIDAQPKLIRYGIAPTKRMKAELPDAKAVKLTERHPNTEAGPFFQARILIREGNPTGKRDERGWASRVAGVRVYMEGFRVLPYGQEGDDWLSLTRDTTDRTRKLRFLVDSTAASKLPEEEDEGLSLLPSKHYFGGVFLTANRSGGLRMLVNREGFVPDASFETMLTIVRRGIDLATRVRAAAKIPTIEDEPEEAAQAPKGQLGDNLPPPGRTLKAAAEGSLQRLSAQATQLEALASDAPAPLAKKLLAAVTEIERAAVLSRELLPVNSMVLVLASVGTQLAAFTHEVNRLLSLAGDLEAAADRIRQEEMPANLKKQLTKLSATASDLRRAIERQAAYLVDIVTPDARRRRSRHRIADVFNATWRLVAPVAEQYQISFRNEVDGEHRSPAMFRAELMAVFTNLLTNAVKAAGESGAIRASSEQLDAGRLAVRLENTGVAVDLDEAERWFKPFESTTVDVDPVLGQGMGLGLGITRDLLGELGATIRFVRPRRPYATAIEVIFVGG